MAESNQTPEVLDSTALEAEVSSSNGSGPGYKTTEWWLTLLTNFLCALYVSGLVESDRHMRLIALALMVLSTLGYTGSRGLAKFGARR